jgi:hypothetical protein
VSSRLSAQPVFFFSSEQQFNTPAVSLELKINDQNYCWLIYVREKYCWLAENKRLKAQTNRVL